jgi:hypothetical protein
MCVYTGGVYLVLSSSGGVGLVVYTETERMGMLDHEAGTGNCRYPNKTRSLYYARLVYCHMIHCLPMARGHADTIVLLDKRYAQKVSCLLMLTWLSYVSKTRSWEPAIAGRRQSHNTKSIYRCKILV